MTPTATVSQVKDGLQARLATITNMRAYSEQPDQVNPSLGGIAYPQLNQIQYHGAMGAGLVQMNFTVTVIIGRMSERTAQMTLDTYLGYGTGSIREAIEADSSLGGIVNQTVVESAGAVQRIDANDTSYFQVDFTVAVYA